MLRGVKPRLRSLVDPEARDPDSGASYFADEVLAPLSALGYDVYASDPPLNAADYGVPQARRRVFTVGFQRGLGVAWEWPAPTHSEDALRWAKYVDGSYWREHGLPTEDPPAGFDFERIERMRTPALPRWRTVRDVIAPTPDPDFELRREKGIVEWHDPDAPAWTITATKWTNKFLRTDDGGYRYLTVAECARLQAFPDGWRFAGRDDDARLKQIGNAVPPPMARALMAAIAAVLS